MGKFRKVMMSAALAITVLALWLASQSSSQQVRNPLAAQMEKNSQLWFAAEQDVAAFSRDVQAGRTKSVGLSVDYALVSLNDGSRYYVRTDSQRSLFHDLLKDKLTSSGLAVWALSPVEPPVDPLSSALRMLNNPSNLPLLLIVLLVAALMLQFSPWSARRGTFKKAEKPDTRFKDVVGVEDAKEALKDIVAYLRNPKKFAELGANAPRGVILAGHPGAGKTLLARAMAGEAGTNFIAISGSDFSDMFLGVGVRRVKQLFERARKQAPCVIFIDEIDGLGTRSSGNSAGETENNRIINTLLVALDGFSPTSGIVVVGATNNLANLDPALIRDGRFDRTCYLNLPNIGEREALFSLYASKTRIRGTTDFRLLARLSTGLSPAAIANVVNSAALLAAKENASAVSQEHLCRSLDEQRLGGAPSSGGQAALSAAARERIAVHEAGHALVAKLLKVGVVEKVSIIPRGQALGVTLVSQEQDQVLQTEPEIRATLAMLLAGREAEALVFKSYSTGAANDLERASYMAYKMAAEFGFSPLIGPFNYAGLPDQDRTSGPRAEAVAEARSVLVQTERDCARLLQTHRGALDRLTAELLEHETVSGDVVDACLIAPTAEVAIAA